MNRILKPAARRPGITLLTSALLALGLVTSAAAASSSGPYPHTREGWLLGLGIGGGSAGLTVNNVSSDRQGGVAAFFRAGYAFNPQLSLELNGNGWSKSENSGTVTFSVSTVAVDFYPGQTGLVLRGGVGAGQGKASVTSNNVTLSSTESGFGALAGAGYEFRLTKTFALGPQVDFGWTSLSDFDANWVNVAVAGTWYFIK